MIHQLRRLLPRQFADWAGTCMIEDDPERGWRDCRVVDISSAGVGIELVNAPPALREGSCIFLAIHLRGVVRHAGTTKHGRLRLGAQFVDLSEEEREYLESVGELDARC
jgi:hypothetical protein